MIKRFLCIAGLVILALPSARAFSLAGPVANAADRWQVQNIGFGSPTDYVAPKNLGEGYRRNYPVMYYAYSAEFLDYFGTAGETNVDAAFGLLNNALTNGVSSYSQGLSEVTLDSQQLNYTAQAYQLYDIKSLTMSLMMPQLGLANPERYVWKIHDRYLPPGGTCPFDEEYTVVQRNFGISPTDFNEIQYSSYVNNTLYSFLLEEICTGAPVLADTVPFPVDPLADTYTSVAGDWLNYGGYYTGLTADDVAGLRYLYNTNNINYETVEGGSLLFDQSTNKSLGEIQFPTNPNAPQGFGTFSLSSLYSFATTNPPAAIAAAFPGVVVASSTPYLVLASNANVFVYFAPPKVGSPFDTVPTLALATNYTLYLATNYVTTFANVVIVTNHPRTTNILMTITTGPKVGSPYGSLSVSTTNYSTIIQTNIPSGDFYTVPDFGTNGCGSGIQSVGLTLTVSTTNLVTSIITNLVTATNSTLFTASQSIISSYVSHIFLAYPVNCSQTTNATGLYEGINKIQFVRADYDSLLGQFFQPFTNGFSMVAITNSTTQTEHFDRTVTAPDILLDAQDLTSGEGQLIVVPTDGITIPVWDQANILPGLAGPGTITSPSVITFDKVGNIYLNGPPAAYFLTTNSILNQLTQFQLLAYGSFDGTTNDPVVYPDGSSIFNLQNQLLVQVMPATLADGTHGVVYSSVQFTASGGSFIAPFTWSSSGVSTNGTATSGLPPGITLSSTGLLSGTPTQAGTYDFTLILTDVQGRSVQWNYTIIIQ